ncbi:hypothetical protein AYO21_08640 [Fonsecaea monophora]|uniref:Uncharacterized protein n=1 Tax=Fonsecaea monophora TaxID=254056 RepID=A0A177EYI6_9EURO|nr:hypothetical protein AYO21_08640 [Fonsecaea monophora]KAH0835396.1 hypothetical protein FOPE_04150 [Fonsecaea pedrosoi]OAG37105.1 hypothetical protein AYO21_08640 [Fonsecaea monophora]
MDTLKFEELEVDVEKPRLVLGKGHFAVQEVILHFLAPSHSCVEAERPNGPDVRDMFARLSLEGLSAKASENTNEKRVRKVEDVHDMFEESRIGASRPILVVGMSCSSSSLDYDHE